MMPADIKVHFQVNLIEETGLIRIILKNLETDEGITLSVNPIQFTRMTEYMDMILASYIQEKNDKNS